MGHTSNDLVLSQPISQPALDQDVQLGMMYDARTSQFFSGISLWDNSTVNPTAEIDTKQLQGAEFHFSESLEESRKNSSLGLEGSLGLDLQLVTATGAARYLGDKKSSTHEARIDVSCSVVRRTRRIPQETLAAMKYEQYLDSDRFTHFVSEVVEGGSATLSYVQSCSTADEARKVTSELRAGVANIPVNGSATVDFSKQMDEKFENVRISYSGAIAESVSNLDDARRVTAEMPEKLAQQMNTLSYKLLPLSTINSKVKCLIRALDSQLVNKTAKTLHAGLTITLKLQDLAQLEVFRKHFLAIGRQISNFQAIFADAQTSFTNDARQLLPELRDVRTDKNEKISELQTTVTLFEQRIAIAEKFIKRKENEAFVLNGTVAALVEDKFVNHLGAAGGLQHQSMVDVQRPRLFLSLSDRFVGAKTHPLQEALLKAPGDTGDRVGTSDDDSDDDVEEEWFENEQIVSNVRQSCATLRQQRLLSGGAVEFGIAFIQRAYRPGTEEGKRVKTSMGDILLDSPNSPTKHLIVTGLLPKAPASPQLTVLGQSITVSWDREPEEREERERSAFPITGFILQYRRQKNTQKDGAFPRAGENEKVTEAKFSASTSTVLLEDLPDDCDHSIAISVETLIGPSEWSIPAVGRTAKLPSVASEMVAFFAKNRASLSQGTPGSMLTPWGLDQSGRKATLFLGLEEVASRTTSDRRFGGEVVVRIMDVAPQFKPEIQASDITDMDNTLVVVFAGTSGHGKSTQINAFISFLFGGVIDDEARVLVVDDRGANQAESVTQIVNCYRIRPLNPLFYGRTILVVDTPGYGDTRGVARDAFVTAAMSEFFKTVTHVNAIIFTCRANETRTTILEPVATYVFSLFAKDVKSCLRTIYTFSDAGEPLARATLRKLEWPIENGEISVNNSAFSINPTGVQSDAFRDGWIQCVRGQFQVMQMLHSMTPIPTINSAQVTKDRILLEQKCQLAEKKILRTATEAQNLIANMGALAKAVGAAPGQKVKITHDVAVQKDLPAGLATTLCLECNFTCHEVCRLRDDGSKYFCAAMNYGNCTVCKQHCSWRKHKNSRYMIVIEERSQWLMPEELIKRWNSNNNSLEGALLKAIEIYLKLQTELRDDLIELADLSEQLTKRAMFNRGLGLIKYVERLISVAEARGAPKEQLEQLATAKNTLILAAEIHRRGEGATRDSSILLDVMGAVQKEMKRRMMLSPNKRAKEEEMPCNLYNDLCDKLPAEIKNKAPKPLRTPGNFSRGALYPANLQAIVTLVQLVLKDGGVVAALASPDYRTAESEGVNSTSEVRGTSNEVGHRIDKRAFLSAFLPRCM
ncbi:hypothetical protein HER10_EVM0001731 [Colletotrichum scovillei]|uniref:uncharacterized protein n=1 Tax=Colletotrichum scovillei TaxID=1209932 RepID=UPI0015C3A96C|nr:uncharacterized protein HER10_EVM0001731 [Colletotrichum scovillei]KAF4773552.1 hypothetical protein HER10_EVM0001731 [Colletotrichum scovillei]